jgi:hypothetical protein
MLVALRRARLSRRDRGLTVNEDGMLGAPVRTTVLMPWLRRSLSAVLKAAPRAYGWCCTHWSYATLVLDPA